MFRKGCRLVICALLFTVHSFSSLDAQSSNASIDGVISDPNGAVVPGAKVVLTSKDTHQTSTFVSDANGIYVFRNVPPGNYQLSVSVQGFGHYVQDGLLVRVGYPIRQNVQLKVQSSVQQVEVAADASPLNFENAELRGSIDPQVIEEVPLLVSGSLRSAANFASLLPGVVHGSGDVSGAHVNGAQAQTGLTILDGISLYNASGTPGLTGAVLDFPQSPDVVSEFQVLTSNYDARYGSAAGVTVENVRSGTSTFHGTAYEFHRDSGLNGVQWGAPAQDKALDVENDFGGNFGGPLKAPFWTKNHPAFFFANFEAFRIRGGVTRPPAISIPSIAERSGDFSDWTDPSGNLIPIYDPATHQQFMGCNGNTPNVICSSDPRLQNSLAKQWFQFLPQPTSSGAVNNFLPAAQPVFLGSDAYSVTEKIDQYIGSKDHISEMFYYKYLPRTSFTTLPAVISNSGTSYKRTSVLRVNWDHTITSKLLNHVAFGFQDDKYYGGGIDGPYANKLPQIPGVASHDYPPQIQFSDNFQGFGTGAGDPTLQPWLAPSWIVNDAVSLTRGKHTISFGGELKFSHNFLRNVGGQSGHFGFVRGETSLNGVGGSPIASFLLEQVDSAQVTFYSTNDSNAHSKSYSLFVGDTWRVTPKLTVSPGIHWEVDPPPFEANDHLSYFDPTLANPGAGNRLGALAFAGSGPGHSGRRIPEDIWRAGVAPRIGVAYAATDRMVIRSGYGLFYDSANMPGWAGGVTQEGYNAQANVAGSQDQTQAAFVLSSGFPLAPPTLPTLSPTFDNGGNMNSAYRPRTANRLPYAQQWNLTVERQFTGRDYITASYVGTKGTRLLSNIAPINALDPKYLAMGAQLNDVFTSDSPVDGVPPPFPGFSTTMTGCDPSVAQALLPFPQYCNLINGLNENRGSSTYHSFQLKAEHRASKGLWLLLSYTNSKLLTDADIGEPLSWALPNFFSPYEVHRNKSLAIEDVPQTLSIAYSYELPFGRGKMWLNDSSLLNRVVGGWKLNGVYRVQSGIPFQISSSVCEVPPQFVKYCSPALLPGKSPFLQSPSHFDPTQPVLDVNAFEPLSSFSTSNPYYTGAGPRVQNFRQPGFSDFDMGLGKVFHISERFSFELRGDAFNLLNAHHFNSVGVGVQSYGNGNFGSSSFTTDIANPLFGMFTGAVSSPRNIQVSGRVSF